MMNSHWHRRPVLIDVGQTEQLQTEDQGGERRHGGDAFEIGEPRAVSRILP